MYYGYEYFCGANVIVEIENMPVLEVAGISFSIQESKRPIYGYSSRFFDAVARGQVLVQGSVLVNYVHQDYLFHAISLGLQDAGLLQTKVDGIHYDSELYDQLSVASQRDAIVKELFNNYPEHIQLADALKHKYWGQEASRTEGDATIVDLLSNPNPHDSFGGLEIKITFGERSVDNDFAGFTGLLIDSVYFLGRGMPIRIDEETIVEEYSFFGRNLFAVQPRYNLRTTPQDVTTDSMGEDGDVTTVTPAMRPRQ